MLERCDALAAFSEEPGRLTRRFATDALRQAGEAVAGWMRAAGMTVRRDAIGNVCGRYDGRGPTRRCSSARIWTPCVTPAATTARSACSSRIACVERLYDAGRTPPFTIEVCGFADEEGVRYGTAYLGSGIVAGRFDPDYLDRAATPTASAWRMRSARSAATSRA